MTAFATPTAGPTPENVAAALVVLSSMGVSPGDLLAATTPSERRLVPTVDEYIDVVAAMVSPKTRQTYMAYWKRARSRWGHRGLDQISASDIAQLSYDCRQAALQRRSSRNGLGAAAAAVKAIACLYRYAERDRHITSADNPARQVDKPKQPPSHRRALPAERLREIHEDGLRRRRDPDLDRLVLRLLTETACRRGGAMSLVPEGLDPVNCQVHLREKGSTDRWQPVSPTLMAALLRLVEQRPASPGTAVLRHNNGKGINDWYFHGLWSSIGAVLPWVAAHGVSSHWLRHTTLTWVERQFGHAVARAYAGHAEPRGAAGATVTYTKAEPWEVAAALAALTGEPHPMAQQQSHW